MKGRIYVSGPMSGLPGMNFDAFNRAAERLREIGWHVVNPVEINPDPSADWLDCVAADLIAMRECTAIALLPGHDQSFGARIEKLAAERLGLVFHAIEDLLRMEAA